MPRHSAWAHHGARICPGRGALRYNTAMPGPAALFGFALVALGLVLTPGPNMMYVVSRSVCQGGRAGLVSLGGVGVGFLIYMVAAACGVTGLLLAVPLAYAALRSAGACYLLYLAWQALRPGG